MSAATTDWLNEALDLFIATEAAGGLEMASAGFHPFVADPMNDVRRWWLPFQRFSDETPNTWGYVVPVDISRDDVLQASIDLDSVSMIGSSQGGFDVVFQFRAPARPHCKNRHQARVAAESVGHVPPDRGVAFVWRNQVMKAFSYGEIMDTLASNPGALLCVARGLPFEDAQALITALGN